MGACSSCTSSAPRTRVNPDQVDETHFSIGKLLGKGGYADVFVARPRSHTQYHDYKRVAVKRIEKRRLIVPCRRKNKDSKGPQPVRLSSTVWIERDVLRRVKASRFHVELLHAFQDEQHLYLIMPFCQGGDLQNYLKTYGLMPEPVARFYMAELMFALEFLHDLHIIYRDLKPRNVLLHANGHLVLTDYGLCKKLRSSDDCMTAGRAGTRGFQAPEVLSGKKYSYSCDFFSLAVTVYRLMTGRRPFGRNGDDFTRPIRCSSLTNEANDIVRALLEPNPLDRLGCAPPGHCVSTLSNEDGSMLSQSPSATSRKGGSHGSLQRASSSSKVLCNTYDWDAVRAHPFFRGVDFDAMRNHQVEPPHKPVAGVVTNFPKSFPAKRRGGPRDRALSSDEEGKKQQEPLAPEQQALFKGFECNVEYDGGSGGVRSSRSSTKTSPVVGRHSQYKNTIRNRQNSESEASGGAVSGSRMSLASSMRRLGSFHSRLASRSGIAGPSVTRGTHGGDNAKSAQSTAATRSANRSGGNMNSMRLSPPAASHKGQADHLRVSPALIAI